MIEESFVILEGNEIKIAFNKGTEILFEGIRKRSFDTFNEHSISDGLTLLYAEMVTAYEAEGKESPYTMESFLLKLTSHEAQSAVMEAQKLAKRWKDRNKIKRTMKEEYYTETYITEWKDKDNVIISLWHMNERDDTEQVGVVELAVYKHGEHEGEVLVWNLYMDEDHRRKGLARKLMNEAHKTAKHLGAKVTALEWSLKESPYWVIEWYTRLGYDEKEIGNGYALMKRE